MQSGYLVITIGFQFFLLVGYLFYFLFRKWLPIDDQISLISWITGLVGVLTFLLLVLVMIILPRMPFADAIFVSTLVIVDFVGLSLLVRETWNRKMTIEHGFIDDET
jgi:hypothetical protein